MPTVLDDLRANMKAARRLPGDVEMREPTASEREFFQANPGVSGMAAEDDRVIMNPFTNLDDLQKRAVQLNEAARVFMRREQLDPAFKLTGEQREIFKNYGTEADIRATIAGRILSGDPSSGVPTAEQRRFVDGLRQQMGVQ